MVYSGHGMYFCHPGITGLMIFIYLQIKFGKGANNYFFLSRLEDELIGEDLDYEYDLDEEEEEALLAGETQEVSLQDLIYVYRPML